MFSPSIKLTTLHGNLRIAQFQCQEGECLIASNADMDKNPPFVRLHSSCVFSESFGSVDCDCSLQLRRMLEHICAEGGYVLYRFEEGRGAGLESKIKAINVQRNRGVDTKTAFESLGFQPDPRNYSVAIQALNALNLGRYIQLNTNNPRKVKALEDAGYFVERKILEIERTQRIQSYFEQKQACLGHMDD